VVIYETEVKHIVFTKRDRTFAAGSPVIIQNVESWNSISF